MTRTLGVLLLCYVGPLLVGVAAMAFLHLEVFDGFYVATQPDPVARGLFFLLYALAPALLALPVALALRLVSRRRFHARFAAVYLVALFLMGALMAAVGLDAPAAAAG